nr:peptidyl-tRNA hydrolase ICT1, mitochondrial [Leptinotarsa decemlineata]
MNIFYKNCEGLLKTIQSHKPLLSNVLHKNASVYKSSISLEKLYPNSSLKLTTPQPPKSELFNGYIPVEQLEITYSRSTGPGGQNVNKVNTKVDVRFHLQSAAWLNEEAKQKLSERLRQKLTKEGYLIFRSDLTRSQHLNLADCLEKIRTAVRNSLVEKSEPSPETEERIRRRLEKSARERLIIKRHKSEIKNDRQAPNVIM